MSEQRIDRMRDRIATLRDAITNAAFECDAHANVTFPAPAVTTAWLVMAARLRAILERDKP